MKKNSMIETLQQSPVIAAVKDDEGLGRCLNSGAGVVFVLYGTAVGIPGAVRRIRQAGKQAVVHLDLIEGLSPQPAAVDYIAQNTEADGIISTRAPLTKHARALGLVAVRRFFLLDSMALKNLDKQLDTSTADLVEVLPGVMPKVIARIVAGAPLPLIAGGLIADKEDVVGALSAGALAASSTNPDVWDL